VQWLLDITPVEKADPETLLQRMIHINVTAIHAPAVTLTEAIFDLCHHPEIHEPLRPEIAQVLGNKPAGMLWTKANIDRLVMMDSFMRESARLTPLSASTFPPLTLLLRLYAAKGSTLPNIHGHVATDAFLSAHFPSQNGTPGRQ
jgi:hypothetical protein